MLSEEYGFKIKIQLAGKPASHAAGATCRYK